MFDAFPFLLGRLGLVGIAVVIEVWGIFCYVDITTGFGNDLLESFLQRF